MQKSDRRTKFGGWFLLIWAVAVAALLLAGAFRPETTTYYDGATLVAAETGWVHV